MGFVDIFLIGIALSMDAFAVSICKGLSVKKVSAKHVLTVGVYFGGFQALMPTVGGNMIREALGKDEEHENDDFSFKAMLPLAVATSIDALAVGISFAFLGVDIVQAALLIGATTFVLSGVGIYVGNVFGAKYKSKAELLGGAVLILIGLKILLEHLGVINF